MFSHKKDNSAYRSSDEPFWNKREKSERKESQGNKDAKFKMPTGYFCATR